MRLNLGCGADIKKGYVNVDFRQTHPSVLVVDLEKLPWPFEDDSADEVLMLDFLEHFSYRKTESILTEVWRILKPGGFVDIQVPDLDHVAKAAIGVETYLCNSCGRSFDVYSGSRCECGQTKEQIAHAAIARLYGGQDYHGNFHYTAFSEKLLRGYLSKNGFHNFELLEEEHQYINWNFKIRAVKKADLWT